MTVQIAERLCYEGNNVAIHTTPLRSYFAMGGDWPRFVLSSTALWRGYVGSWEIIDDRLYLISLEGTLEGGAAASLAIIFPEFPDRVFAHWYSGTIRIPQDELLSDIHLAYDSAYESDLLLDVERGVVVSTSQQHRGGADFGGIL